MVSKMNEKRVTIGYLARHNSLSERTLRKHLGEIPHVRLSPRGKILIRIEDFENWMAGRLRQAKSVDPLVGEILQELAAAGKGY